MKKCPYCAEEIQDDAVICRFCNRKLPITLYVDGTPRIFRNPCVGIIVVFVVILVIFVVLISLIDGGNKSEAAPSCVDAEITKCTHLTDDFMEVKGMVTNNCNGSIFSAKLLVSIYNSSGKEVNSDDEYVQGVNSGEWGTFEQPLEDPRGEATRCGVKVKTVVFGIK